MPDHRNEDAPRGAALLDDPVRNKGTAFSAAERRALGLEGLLPPAIETIERQLERVLDQLERKPDDLERYVYLSGLADRNQTLFFRTLMSDPARFVPIVYDPTIAEACLRFGQIYRRARGLHITRDMTGRMAAVLRNHRNGDVRFICVSSGGRILGLGDIGANGMVIPIGKLQLYTACAGVPPSACLPVLLDIGTTDAALRADPLYLGSREPPPENDDEIDALVDEFMDAAEAVFPGVCVHFEDWKGSDATRLLARYRAERLVYNDDIQGTAAVALAGIITALRIRNETLADQRVLCCGAGSAGIGIADLIVTAMADEGLSEADARERIILFDANGLIEPSRDDLDPSQLAYARDGLEPADDLAAVVETVRPTILIGVSTSGGRFTEAVVRAMARHCDRPVIFPLSNPTDNAECTPQQAYEWTNGKALVACGVQFPDVTLDGRTFRPGQANNFYVFPAVALAVYATRPKRITDRMFIDAARAIAEQVGQDDRDRGELFPSQSRILSVEITTATRVAEAIFERGEAGVERPRDMRAWIEGLTYEPEYR